MSILTGQEIKKQIKRKHIRIGNYNENRVQPNSYDLTLGDKVSYFLLDDHYTQITSLDLDTPCRRYVNRNGPDISDSLYRHGPDVCVSEAYLDTAQENEMYTKPILTDGYILYPNTLYIVETVESVWSDKYVVEVSGTSSLARLGVTVHKTAGYANIGHEFKWILEIEVTHPVKVYPGMKIAQMYFHTIKGSNRMKYRGKYKDAQMNDTLCGSLSHLDK